MQERHFINKVHKKLPPSIYKWKINDAYHGGVPDCFYSGNAGLCFVEYKYDGVRVIAIVKNGSTTLYSRNGKIFNNFPHIESALSKKSFNNYVFDGEVMSEDFQALMKQVHRKSGAKTDDAFLALFDCLPLNEFNLGKSKLKNFERKKL